MCHSNHKKASSQKHEEEQKMIPISSSTTLTAEKAAKLLQSLVDLRDNTHVDLPEEISKRVDRILKAQQKLTKDISLSKKIDETSGLEILDGQFITHNDSGGEPKLYYLDKSPVRLLSGVIHP